MARAGRTYNRDSRGRFASGGGSSGPRRGAKQAGGTLKARVSLAKSKAKLAANQTSAQRGAVTRASRKLAEVRKQSLRKMPTSGRPNTMRGKVQRRPVVGTAGSPRNGIRAAGRLTGARNGIRRFNAPDTFDAQAAKLDRALKPLKESGKRMRDIAAQAKDVLTDWKRQKGMHQARDIANRLRKGIVGEVARDLLKIMGTKEGQKAIHRRLARASTAAARGSKQGKKAVGMYLNQLAAMGPGKSRKGKNTIVRGMGPWNPSKKVTNRIVPGPRNRPWPLDWRDGGGGKGKGGRKKK